MKNIQPDATTLDRVILHCDCNSFYASVELINYPELKQKPVAVSGSADDRHGIILAKNEPAKKYGIKTAETVWQALRKCPELILLPPHHRRYRQFSKRINEVYASFSDLVEPFGIDESWLDITGSWRLFGESPVAVADSIRNKIRDTFGITISVGVSFNKVFAKLGSDYKKPDATTVITRQNYQQIVWPLPVGALLYVGHRAGTTLAELGIKTIGELAAADTDMLTQVFGKQGYQLHLYASGEENSRVKAIGEGEPVKSVGNGLTFRRNLLGLRDIKTGVLGLADEVATRLRRYGLYANSVQVLIKDPDLKSISRQRPLPFATNLARDISKTAVEIIQEHWNLAKPIRMITITAAHLTEEPGAEQTSLFQDAPSFDERHGQLEASVDDIRRRYGTAAILPAGQLQNDIGLDTTARPEEETD